MRRFLPVLSLIVFIGCGGERTAPMAVATAPYEAYAGDWICEAYVGDGTEPVVLTLLKANESAAGWTTKFTHIEHPLATSVSLRGDSLVTEFGPFPSALREGATVRNVTTVMRAQGDEMVGRFVAYYDGDPVSLRGRMIAKRIK